MASDDRVEPGPQSPLTPRPPRYSAGAMAPRFPDTSRHSGPAPSAEGETVRPFGTTGSIGASPSPGRAPTGQNYAQPAGSPQAEPLRPAGRSPWPPPIGPSPPSQLPPSTAPIPQQALRESPSPAAPAPATPHGNSPGLATVFGLVQSPVSQPGYDPFAPQRPSPTRAPIPAASRAAPSSQFDDPFEPRRARTATAPFVQPRSAPPSSAASGESPYVGPEDASSRGGRPATGQHGIEPGRERMASRPYVDPARSASRVSAPQVAAVTQGYRTDPGPAQRPLPQSPLNSSGAGPAAGQGTGQGARLGSGPGADRDRFTSQFAVSNGASPVPASQSAYAPAGPQRPISQAFGFGAAQSSPGFDSAQRSGSTRPGVVGSAPTITTPSGFDPSQRGRPASSAGVDPLRISRPGSSFGSDLFDAPARFNQHPSRDRDSAGRTGRGPMATPVDPAEEDFLLAVRAMGVQPSLQDAELQLLAQMAWRWQLGAGETLYGEGDQIAAAFLMGNGILRLECAALDGPVTPIGALKQGDWGGELAFAGGGVHGTAAVAATDVSLFAFDMARLRQLAQAQPGLYVRLLAVTAVQQAKRQRNDQQRIEQFCQAALPRPIESPQESAAPTGLGRLLSRLAGGKEEP